MDSSYMEPDYAGSSGVAITIGSTVTDIGTPLCVTAQVSALLAVTQRRRGAGAELGPGLPPLIVFRTTNILTLFTVKL